MLRLRIHMCDSGEIQRTTVMRIDNSDIYRSQLYLVMRFL